MAKIAYLECARCGNKVSPDRPQSLCPVDAGVLLARYDMDALGRSTRRDRPAAIAATPGPSAGMWRYADLLPDAAPVTLGEGWTPLLASRRYPGLLVKHEAANPTGSLADRGISLAVTMARHFGVTRLAGTTTASTAVALAAYAAVAGIAAHLLLPGDIPSAAHLQATLFGAELTLLDASPSAPSNPPAAAGTAATPADAPTFDLASLDAFRIEGEKTIAYELIEQLGWVYPEVILLPDPIISPDSASFAPLAISKAFAEMEHLGWVSGRRPRLYTAASAPSASDPSAMSPVLATTRDILDQTGGRTVSLDAADTLACLRDYASHEGLFLSPEGAAAVAAYEALLRAGELRPTDRVVVINPASGLIHADAVAAALHLRRRRTLPTSLPVGGIITPV